MNNPLKQARRLLGGLMSPAGSAEIRYDTTHFERPLIELKQVSKSYPTPSGPFFALRSLNLTIQPGEFVAVLGKSGAGKSTLVNLLTGIDRVTEGEIFVNGTPLHRLAEEEIAGWRGQTVGVVFQQFQLMPMLSCAENIMLPMDFGNRFGNQRARRARALRLLHQVDIEDQAHKLPSTVSGGQQQRVAIARALANDPPLIVADEPTGNLDSTTAMAVFALFESLVAQGKTVVMVTHDGELASRVNRRLTLIDGVIIADETG